MSLFNRAELGLMIAVCNVVDTAVAAAAATK